MRENLEKYKQVEELINIYKHAISEVEYLQETEWPKDYSWDAYRALDDVLIYLRKQMRELK